MTPFKKTDLFWLGRIVDDFPLMRWFIKKNKDLFNKFYYVVNYRSHEYPNKENSYIDLIKNDLKDCNFEMVMLNTEYSIRDWRDQSFNEFLRNSNSEYIFHMDPDVYIDQSYIEYLSTQTRLNFDVLSPVWGNRIWPFVFTKRELIDKTTRDFSPHTYRYLIDINQYNKTGNLKQSCTLHSDFHGDHGDRLVYELLNLTDFNGWELLQNGKIECIHYNGRCNYHTCLTDLVNNPGGSKMAAFNDSDRKVILSSQKEIHRNYLNKMKDLGINLFDRYQFECKVFFEKYDGL